MKLFAVKKIRNSTFFQRKTVIILACRPFWWEANQKSISISIANAKCQAKNNFKVNSILPHFLPKHFQRRTFNNANAISQPYP